LTQLIQRESDLTISGEPKTPRNADENRGRPPDIFIADISLKRHARPRVGQRFAVRFPSLPVLILSMHDESLYAERVLRAGAKGYITKQEATKKNHAGHPPG